MSKRQVIDRGTFVPFLLEVITNHIGANANRLYQNEFGVGLAEWRVLSAVAIEPGTTAMALSIQSGIDAAAVSRVVYAMTESGLLSQEVDRADRRRRKLTLTKRGTLLHTAMLKTALIEEERLLHAISSEERRALISILQRLYARLGDRIPKIPATANDEQD